jgi:hypothetical protein
MPVHRCITPAMEVRVSDSQRAARVWKLVEIADGDDLLR